jgi:acid phosphatase family membrane protein YuiD
MQRIATMDIAYLVTPLITWITVGPIKFLINSAKARKWAFNLVGNGGFPSNHSAVVSSMATLIALREGIGHPAFGVAVTLCFIVIIDANSLRQHVGKQAAAINRLAKEDQGGTLAARAHGPHAGGNRRRPDHRHHHRPPRPRRVRPRLKLSGRGRTLSGSAHSCITVHPRIWRFSHKFYRSSHCD